MVTRKREDGNRQDHAGGAVFDRFGSEEPSRGWSPPLIVSTQLAAMTLLAVLI